MSEEKKKVDPCFLSWVNLLEKLNQEDNKK
jgi:hypothetical protein